MMSSLSQRIQRLNSAQRESVEAILQSWDAPAGDFVFPIVEGPPGTGKTRVGVLASARYREENRRPQVAYLCYTHFAADKALEGFIELGFTPDDVLRVVDHWRSRFYQNFRYSNYYIAYNKVEELTRAQRDRLRRVPILITTLHGSGKILKEIQTRPLIVVDEFSQCPPTLFFSTLSKIRSRSPGPSGYTLLGDPNQLPVITSQPYLRPNIGTFILSRNNEYQPYQLTYQYRMHSSICQVVNALRDALNASYHLQTHGYAQGRTLTRLGYVWNRDCPSDFEQILDPNNACIIINTDNLPGMDDVSLGGSKYFSAEARLAARLADMMYQSYVKQNGEHLLSTILSPYTAQNGMIKGYLQNPSLKEQCITIYQAQGREYPCVVISFARKNPSGWIGFLGEPELRAQTYVACSRAMAKLIILLSFDTFVGRGYTDFDYLVERGGALIVNAELGWVRE